MLLHLLRLNNFFEESAVNSFLAGLVEQTVVPIASRVSFIPVIGADDEARDAISNLPYLPREEAM